MPEKLLEQEKSGGPEPSQPCRGADTSAPTVSLRRAAPHTAFLGSTPDGHPRREKLGSCGQTITGWWRERWDRRTMTLVAKRYKWGSSLETEP